jgi:diketogulonate reductase-like aldo/keto reductase
VGVEVSPKNLYRSYPINKQNAFFGAYMKNQAPHHLNRRQFMQYGLAAAATAPLLATPFLANAQTANPAAAAPVAPPPRVALNIPAGLITRTIPKTNEVLPVVGLGSFLTFDVLPGGKREHIRDVMQRFWEGGGRVIDTSPQYGSGELSIGDFAAAMGINEQMFVSNKVWTTGEFLSDESTALRIMEQSMSRLWRNQIDVMTCHNLVNVDWAIPILRAWKKEGRIRYLGATHFENPYHPVMAQWIERGNLDFIQINYSIFNRAAEERILPLCAERGVAVMTNMPFEKARLFKVVENQPLPAFAREFGAQNWAQYFLKWVISHPAVTCVIPATANPEHMAQNIGALRGPLPDKAMRERMVKHMETIPGFAQIATMPWYPDKQAQYQGLIRRAQGNLRSRT